MAAQPRQVLSELIAGVTERRWDDLPALYAEDTLVEHPLGLPVKTRLEGRAALAAHFRSAADLPLRMEAENVVMHDTADPEVVIGEFDYVGTDTSTGAAFRVANVFVVRVRDGLIVESRDYTDHARLAAAFGRLGRIADALAGSGAG